MSAITPPPRRTHILEEDVGRIKPADHRVRPLEQQDDEAGQPFAWIWIPIVVLFLAACGYYAQEIVEAMGTFFINP